MTTSDLLIPPAGLIIDRALDYHASAVRMADDATMRQIERLIDRVPSARLCWQLGTLLVNQYQVTRAGCNCLNAQKCAKRQCWHVALFELLLDMFDTDCETADMAALDPPIDIPNEPAPQPPGGPPPPIWPEEGGRALGNRIARARSLVWAVA